MRTFKAIAAMSRNRVIGAGGKLPWHLPEELKWFKETTMGHAIVMGRKTWESLGRPLPGRLNYVLTRTELSAPAVTAIHSLNELEAVPADKDIFIIGGAQLFELALPRCSELFLTIVNREVEGDAFMPPFEHLFALAETLRERPEFSALLYQRRTEKSEEPA